MLIKASRLFSAVVFAILLAAAPAAIAPVTSARTQSQTETKEVKVWVNTHSGVYHCPGSQWYGKTKEGKYLTECEAKKAGYRPAYGNPCGQDCGTTEDKPAASPKPSPPSGATALCKDGTYSYSQHARGTCSRHGGVSEWINHPSD
jgi:uncharacterized protein DUF3761